VVIGGPVAGSAAPYIEAGTAGAARFGKLLLTQHGGEFEQVEFDALAGATADVSFRAENLEIVAPLNQYITPAQALPKSTAGDSEARRESEGSDAHSGGAAHRPEERQERTVRFSNLRSSGAKLRWTRL
jgi:hypothetical protein